MHSSIWQEHQFQANLNNNPAYDRQAFTSILKKRGNLTNDEVDSKVEAILAVMES